MNPKDLTNEDILIQYSDNLLDDAIGTIDMKLDDCLRAELLRRLAEVDALRKENEELRAQAQKGGRP